MAADFGLADFPDPAEVPAAQRPGAMVGKLRQGCRARKPVGGMALPEKDRVFP